MTGLVDLLITLDCYKIKLYTNKKFARMKYGYFDAQNREYVITRPDTPTPWINYLGSDEYCALISNTAGGYSFHKDPKEQRILRFRYNNIPPDRPGRYIYIRDNKTEDYWSATWQPVLKNQKSKIKNQKFGYECRHGMGYTLIKSEYAGIAADTLYFVPLGENLEVWRLNIKNLSGSTRDISLFTYAEFCMWQAVMDMTDFQYTLNIARTRREGSVIYHLTGCTPKIGDNRFAYLASSEDACGWDGDREAFIGPYRSESDPIAVERGQSFNSDAKGGNPIGSLWNRIRLKKGESRTIIFILGVGYDMKETERFIKKYRHADSVAEEFGKLKSYWSAYFTNFAVSTPDKEVDLMANTWHQYQCRTTFNWSRSASYYESGIGRGMGFRDSNQDTLGVVHAIPDRVKTRIMELMANQFENGSSYHQFFPLTKKGEKGGYSDDPLWLIVSCSGYIKETGDVGFLDEIVPFADSGSGTIYEHLKKAVDYVYSRVGPRELPLMGFADWNDCLNLGGKNDKAETVWVGQFLVYAARELVRLAELKRDREGVIRYKEIADSMRRIINDAAWDGDWYIRAFDDFGSPVGSSKNKEGKIDLITQAWAVMAGVSDEKRSFRCMDMVKKYLDSEHGVMLCAPPYTEYDPKIGAVGTFAPGLKENGGVFCHANPWAMIAETILGRGETAFDYYKKIAPVTRNKVPDIHKTEPYVYAQYIAGSAHPEFGRARNSWLTGSAAWNFVAISNYILGVRADYHGLVVDPCIPSSWKGFRVTRKFRGAVYEIEVSNPGRVNKGVKHIEVDGKKIGGHLIPVFNDNKTHRVKVLMGKTRDAFQRNRESVPTSAWKVSPKR